MTSTCGQIGGARIGLFSATWPFAWLTADRDAIALRCLFKFTFPREQIASLSRYRLISTGLKIEHTIPRYPKFIVFWALNFDMLKVDLEALGYTVSD